MSDEPDETGKVTFKYEGDVVDELDWNIPGDREKIVQRAHRGIMYDKNADKFHAAVKRNDDFDKVMEEAGTSDEALAQLVGTIEGYIGRKLTVEEKVDIQDDVNTDELSTNPVIKKLSEQLDQLNERIKKGDERDLYEKIDSTNKKLMDKYDGSNGYPKFEVKAVQKFIDENQFFLPDIAKNYEEAYLSLNREAIYEVERKGATDKETQRKKDIDDARSPKGGPGGIQDESKTYKTLDDVAEDVIAQAKRDGKSFV